MHFTSFTNHLDLAQVVLYAFWLFFAGLVFYLRQEDRREGYPLETDPYGTTKDRGYLLIPEPKTFVLHNGHETQAPNFKGETRELALKRSAPFPGAPFIPTGNPMLDGVGPGSYAQRSDTPDLTWDGHPKIVPLRAAEEYWVNEGGPDPRGLPVFGCDDVQGGVVSDIWIDKSEYIMRFLEVTTPSGRKVLLPSNLQRLNSWRRRISVNSITGAQFEAVPGLKSPDQITLLEEDKVFGYYGGGTLYATPDRQEPLL